MMNEYISINAEKTAFRSDGDESIVINLENSTFHTLNSMGTFIWAHLDGKTTLKDIINRVCAEFEVEIEYAKKDCKQFIDELLKEDLIRISSSPLEDI